MAPFVSQLQRTFWAVKDLEVYRSNEAFDPYPSGMEVCEKAHPSVANTIASLLAGEVGLHAPCLDIDWPAWVGVESNIQIMEVRCAWPKVLEYDTPKQLSGLVPTTTEELTSICNRLRQFSFIQHVLFSGQQDGLVLYRFHCDKEPAILILPSKSHRHFHCYIETAMSWNEYTDFVRLLNRLGIVQYGFYAMTNRRKMSHLRKPSPELFVQTMTPNRA